MIGVEALVGVTVDLTATPEADRAESSSRSCSMSVSEGPPPLVCGSRGIHFTGLSDSVTLPLPGFRSRGIWPEPSL